MRRSRGRIGAGVIMLLLAFLVGYAGCLKAPPLDTVGVIQDEPPGEPEPVEGPVEPNPENTLSAFETINLGLSGYGCFVTPGMTADDYSKAMSWPWETLKPTGNAQDLSIDLAESYSYTELESFIFNLTNRQGFTVRRIGKSAEGRTIYSVSLGFESAGDVEKGSESQPETAEKPTVMLTGQIHANEFAGGLYILKQLDELAKQAETDEYVRLLLENVQFETVPIINPDGREQNIDTGSTSKKSNNNGVDLNRNFPSVNACQLANGYSKSTSFSKTPGNSNYPGPSLGSEPETQALMKWLNTFVPYASYYLDYHQQGRGLYYGKPWDEISAQENNAVFGRAVIDFLNAGVTSRGYIRLYDSNNYCYDGDGGTITDYAVSVARGMTFSPAYGVLTLQTEEHDTPLMVFKRVDNHKDSYKPLNRDFQAVTVEITRSEEGRGQPLGYARKARELMDEEYYRHNYDKLLVFLAENALGPEKSDMLRDSLTP